MANQFNNRVYGCAIVKAINSNFNADFSHQPRTLPDGRVYATDKALKHTVRRYLKNVCKGDGGVLYFRRLNDNMNPLTLADTYTELTGSDFSKDAEAKDKKGALKKLLSIQDVRLFGSTFAAKKGKATINLSIHGPVQFTHGLNQFFNNDGPVGEVYSEQISAPFSTDSGSEAEAAQTTLGRQSKLREGHYVYHFSVNPANLSDLVGLFNGEVTGLTDRDMECLKEGMRVGVTYLDSASKAGSENELLLWVQLKEDSKLVLPSFVEMVKIQRQPGQKAQIDLSEVSALLNRFSDDVERMELYYLPEQSELLNAPQNAQRYDLISGKSLTN